MIFAIYRGLSDGKEDKGEGRFTKGRLYLAEPEVDDSVVVDIDKMSVTDDNMEKIWIEPDNGRFEYPEEVFAVVLHQLGGKVPGEVVTIDDVDDDGFVSVSGMGFVRPRFVELLDSVIVKPGMMVYDRQRTRWARIKRVDECLRICLEDKDEMQDCTSFFFAISEGELSTMPLLRCLNDKDCPNLNQGTIYRVKGLDENGKLLVVDDNGEEKAFDDSRFEFI